MGRDDELGLRSVRLWEDLQGAVLDCSTQKDTKRPSGKPRHNHKEQSSKMERIIACLALLCLLRREEGGGRSLRG